MHYDSDINIDEMDSFRDIRKRAVSFGIYQKRLFLMMGFYWVTASFFLVLPFYFFKAPVYCINSQLYSPDNCLGTWPLIKNARIKNASKRFVLSQLWGNLLRYRAHWLMSLGCFVGIAFGAFFIKYQENDLRLELNRCHGLACLSTAILETAKVENWHSKYPGGSTQWVSFYAPSHRHNFSSV